MADNNHLIHALIKHRADMMFLYGAEPPQHLTQYLVCPYHWHQLCTQLCCELTIMHDGGVQCCGFTLYFSPIAYSMTGLCLIHSLQAAHGSDAYDYLPT